MSFDFLQSEYEYLLNNCRFNEINGEKRIFELRCKGCSIVQIAFETHLSVPTVNRRIASIKRKIVRAIGT